MSDRPWPMGLALAGALALAGGGCVLGDVFGADGLEQVTLTFEGPTGTLRPCDRVPFSVTVRVGGTPVRNAWVSVAMLTDSVVALTPLKDSLVALAQGTDTLVAEFESSMLVDTTLELKQVIRVVGPPCAPLP